MYELNTTLRKESRRVISPGKQFILPKEKDASLSLLLAFA